MRDLTRWYFSVVLVYWAESVQRNLLLNHSSDANLMIALVTAILALLKDVSPKSKHRIKHLLPPHCKDYLVPKLLDQNKKSLIFSIIIVFKCMVSQRHYIRSVLWRLML